MTGETEKEVSGWSVDTLRAHVQALLEERDLRYEQRYQAGQTALQAALTAERTAVNAALAAQERATQAALVAQKEQVTKSETAADKRFELLNELRTGVATRDQLDALEKIVSLLRDDVIGIRQRGAGISSSVAMMLAVGGLALAAIAFITR